MNEDIKSLIRDFIEKLQRDQQQQDPTPEEQDQ